MESILFSASSLLGTIVSTASEIKVGTLEDIICDQENGRCTYYIISTDEHLDESVRLYAIHYSYFNYDPTGGRMVFLPTAGEAKYVQLPTLPSLYASMLVLSYQEFKLNVVPSLTTANHRTDQE